MSSESAISIHGDVQVRVHDATELHERASDLVGDADPASNKHIQHLLARSAADWDQATPDDPAPWERWETIVPSLDDLVTTDVDPIEEHHTENVTTVQLHQLLADYINPNVTTPTAKLTHFAVGNQGTPAAAVTDTRLHSEVYREAIGSVTDAGTKIHTSTFLASAEANGFTLHEVGLFSAATGGLMFNHAIIPSVTKDSGKTLTFEITLTFQTA